MNCKYSGVCFIPQLAMRTVFSSLQTLKGLRVVFTGIDLVGPHCPGGMEDQLGNHRAIEIRWFDVIPVRWHWS